MPDNAKRTYFSGLAERWDSLPAPPGAAGKVRRFLEKSLSGTARWVLDAGCGTGILLPDLLAMCPPETSIVEMDFAETMLFENVLKSADPRVSRICGDARHVPFAAGCLDLVLCFGVVPHLEDVPSALGELWRLLRAGGTFTVGHIMASRELNAFHRSLEGPVSGDELPPATVLAEMLAQLGARKTQAEEEPGWYFVRAEKA
jgi:ubiquinone/menaquinone biosynthesis C-methylase UbiE